MTASAESIIGLNPYKLNSYQLAAASSLAKQIVEAPDFSQFRSHMNFQWGNEVEDLNGSSNDVTQEFANVIAYRLVHAAMIMHNPPFAVVENEAQRDSLLKFGRLALLSYFFPAYNELTPKTSEMAYTDRSVLLRTCQKALGR